MGSFKSFVRYIESASAMGFVIVALAFIVIFPIMIVLFGVAVFMAWWKHHNRTCQHFTQSYLGNTRRQSRIARRGSDGPRSHRRSN